RGAQHAGLRKTEVELEKPQLIVAPRVGNPLRDAVFDRLDHGVGRCAVLQLDAELDQIMVSGAQYTDLPITRNRWDIFEELLEEPGAEVAHPAVHHFVRASTNLRNPTRALEDARARFVQEARDVGRAIANERHDLARQRRVDELAVSIPALIDDLAQQVEIVHVIAASDRA